MIGRNEDPNKGTDTGATQEEVKRRMDGLAPIILQVAARSQQSIRAVAASFEVDVRREIAAQENFSQ